MNKKKLIIIISVCAIIIGGAVATFILLNKNKKDNKEVETTTKEVVTEETTTTTEETTTEPTTEEVTTVTTTQTKTTSVKTTKVTTTKLTVVDTKKVDSIVEENVKYGVKFQKINSKTITTYSDGSTKEKDNGTKTVIDNSSYAATTNELVAEATSISNSNVSKANEMLGYVNGYRAEVGSSPLVIDNELSKAATVRAMELAYSGLFSHTRPNGSDCFTVIDELGISNSYAGENIAAGFTSVADTANQWRNSEGHYANMINTNYTKLGVGSVCLDGTKYKCYWVQLFT